MTENPAQLSGFDRVQTLRNLLFRWDNGSAQNGPGIAVVAHRPGPDLSASLTTDEEH